MPAIPPNLNQHLHDTLARCGPFDSNAIPAFAHSRSDPGPIPKTAWIPLLALPCSSLTFSLSLLF